MLNPLKRMVGAVLDIITGVITAVRSNQSRVFNSREACYPARTEEFAHVIAESSVAEPTIQEPAMCQSVPVSVDVAPVAFSQPGETMTEDCKAAEQDIGATAEQVRLIADRLDSVKAEIAAFAKNAANIENLTKTVNQQMEIIRELSRRVRELDDQIVSGLVIRPMLNGLILLYDSITTHRRSISAGGMVDCKKAFAGIATEVIELLAQYGVTPVCCEGGVFDPKQHKVVDTVPERAPRANEIAEVKRIGFEKDGKLLRRSDVVIVKSV